MSVPLLGALVAGVAFFSVSPTARAERARAPSGCKARPAVDARALSGEAADRLRLAPGTTRSPRNGEFLLRDRRILIQSSAGEEGDLYSPSAYALFRAQLDEDLRFRRAAENQPFHVLRGLLDDGAEFGKKAPALVEALRARLLRDGSATGNAKKGSDALQAEPFLARWRASGCRLDPSLFRELTALAGARAIARDGGAWSSRTVDDGVVEPVIEVTLLGAKHQLEPYRIAALLLDQPGSLDQWLDEELAASSPAGAATINLGNLGAGSGAAPTGESGPDSPRITPPSSSSSSGGGVTGVTGDPGVP